MTMPKAHADRISCVLNEAVRFDPTSSDTTAVLDALPDIAAIIERGGEVVATNAAWREFSTANGGDAARTGVGNNYLGCAATANMSAADLAIFRGIKAVFSGAGAFEADYPCHSATEMRWFKLIARPLASRACDGDITHALITHRNITASKLHGEQIEDTIDIKEHMSALVASSPYALVSIDLQGRVTSWNAAAEALYGFRSEEVLGKSLETIYPPDWPVRVQAYIDDTITGRQRTFNAVRRHKSGDQREVTIVTAPIVVGGQVVGISNVHRLREGAGSVLPTGTEVNQELNHRLKNMMAVVSAVARQTGRLSKTVAEFQQNFAQRLDGLAKSNDLLLGNNAGLVTLDTIVRTHLHPFVAPDDRRITISGPQYIVQRESVQPIGMALHELATNAAKYGALSIPGGKLEISWRVEVRGGRRGLTLTWAERGLANVRHPQREGFGRQVLTVITPRSVGGTAEYAFEPEGVRWQLWKPV